MMEMISSESFMDLVPNECIRTNAIDRISKALTKSIVVVFLKGTMKRPFDGYQREVIEILDASKVRYTVYDVMRDNDLREILKERYRCPSYPQIFIDTKFVGGLNFLKKALLEGGLASVIPSTEVKLDRDQKIAKLIEKGRIMIFLQGSLRYPSDFDSEEIVLIFREPQYQHLKSEINGFDLKKDLEIRPALLAYSRYYMTPQLYVD